MTRIRPMLPVMGITRIGDVTGLDRIGIPVVVVTRPNSRSLAVSQGKGVTLDCARVSGVMESIEGWHAERIDLPLRLATPEEMRWAVSTVDLSGLPRDETSTYGPDHDMLWIEGWDLLNSVATWVPYEVVHTRFILPRPAGSGCFVASSNGLASGNNLVEAASHALCEIIERDAVTLWQALPPDIRDERQINLATIDDPIAQGLLALCDDANVLVSIWDATSDVGVPTFYCLIAEATDDPFHRLHAAAGMGCHPSKSVALTRAITEAAQSRLTIIAGSRDDVVRQDYARIRDPEVLGRTRGSINPTPSRNYDLIDSFDTVDLQADLEWLLGQLRSAGIKQAVAFDLTKPQLDIAVVRIVVPGMETAALLGTTLGGRALNIRAGQERAVKAAR